MRIVCILPLLESEYSPLHRDSCSILQAIECWNRKQEHAGGLLSEVYVLRTTFEFEDDSQKDDFRRQIISLSKEKGEMAFFVLGDPAMEILAETLASLECTIPVFVLACRHCFKYENIFYLWRDAATIANRISQKIQELGCKKVLLLSDDGKYGDDYRHSFSRFKETYNLPIDNLNLENGGLSACYRFGTNDNACTISAKLQAIHDNDYDAVVILGYGVGFENCLAAVSDKYRHARLFTDHFFTTPKNADDLEVYYPWLRISDVHLEDIGPTAKICFGNDKSDASILIETINRVANVNNGSEVKALAALTFASLDVLYEAERRKRGSNISDALFGLKHVETFVGPFIVQNCEGSCFPLELKSNHEQLTNPSSGAYRSGDIAYLLQTIDDYVKRINKSVVRKCIDKGVITGELQDILDSIFDPVCRLFQIKTVYLFDDIGGSLGCNYVFGCGSSIREKNICTLLSSGVLSCLDDPLQINAEQDDVEQNDAVRIYIGHDDAVYPLVYFVKTRQKPFSVDGIILARTERAALHLWKKRGFSPRIDSVPIITELNPASGHVNSCLTWVKQSLVFANDGFLRSAMAIRQYAYFIPGVGGAGIDPNQKDAYTGWIVVDLEGQSADSRLGYLPLRILNTIVSRIFAPLHSALTLYGLEVANIKSAIGSIMSRNGSHNIGSHVLAALSHNVGTMPDDRMLYQYIQHRMDYIATATTERPAWTMPTKFVSSMMRRFLSQRHLLDYISRSEGLKAYQFQNPHEDTSSLLCQPGTIRVHIRRIDDDDASWNKNNKFVPAKAVNDFIVYPKGQTSCLEKDIDVAIPGGVIGQHAFFTILENILRNAAKHEWAVSEEVKKPPEEDDEAEVSPKKGFVSPENITTQPGLATDGMNATGMKTLFYGIPADVLDEKPFAVADKTDKTVSSVSLSVLDSDGHDAKGQFDTTDSAKTQTEAGAGKVKLATKNDTPAGTYQAMLTAICSDGTVAKGNPLTFVIRPRHLDIYVDFQDRPQEGKVAVVIWSDGGGKCFDEDPSPLQPSEITSRLEQEMSTGKLDLEGLSPLQRLQVKMVRPFIAADGHLRRENWGLAEMRISAGYLNVSKIEDIGGISQSDARFNIIQPVVVESDSQENGKTGKHCCLGYLFSIPKPKELLVILPDSMIPAGEEGFKSKTESFSKELKRFGVELAFESTLESLSGSDTAQPFSYVLFSGKPAVLEKMKLGYRLLSSKPPESRKVAKYSGALFKRSIHDILDKPPESFVNNLLTEVYSDWMNFVKKRYRGKNKPLGNTEFPLVIDVGQEKKEEGGTQNNSGAEQSLISDTELLDFIFKNTFNSAVDSYKERKKASARADVLRGLQLWRDMGIREVHVETTRPEVGDDGVVVAGKFVHLKRAEMIRRQLEKWCDCKYATTEDQEFMQRMKAWLEAWDCNSRDRNVPSDLKDFVGYLGSVIFDQAKAFLCKYEERIVTLPKAMEVKFAGGVANSHMKEIGGQRVVFTSSDDYKNSPDCADAIAYWRHEDYKTERKYPPVYREALSGAQSYFSVFSELAQASLEGNSRTLGREETGLVAKLVECGLSKILIVDERVARFVSEHQDVKVAFSHIGIDVLDADSPKTVEMFKKQAPLSLEKLKSYDIAIVHQGVIDKRLHDSGALSSVDEFCVRMEENVSCFAITTGRGTPSTIPPNARVLPFSVIESTLFTRYPEKFILVDTIMNLLPIGKQEGQ